MAELEQVLTKLDELITESRLTRAEVRRIGSRVTDVEERVQALEDAGAQQHTNGSGPPPEAA